MSREDFTEWLFNHIKDDVDMDMIEFGDDGNDIYIDMKNGDSFKITITKE